VNVLSDAYGAAIVHHVCAHRLGRAARSGASGDIELSEAPTADDGEDGGGGCFEEGRRTAGLTESVGREGEERGPNCDPSAVAGSSGRGATWG